MFNAILTGITAGIVAFFCCFFAFYLLYSQINSRVTPLIKEFFITESETVASPFALVCGKVSKIIGQEVAGSLKSAFLGIQSVESKNAKKIEAEMIAGQNPLLATIMASFPAVAKRINKNPALASLALDMAGKLAQKAPPAGDHRDAISFKF